MNVLRQQFKNCLSTWCAEAWSHKASGRPSPYRSGIHCTLFMNAQEAEPERHEDAWARIRGADGILVPGGFGSRGVEGKIAAACYAREHAVPYLGICLGMQIAVGTPGRHPHPGHITCAVYYDDRERRTHLITLCGWATSHPVHARAVAACLWCFEASWLWDASLV